MINKKNLFSAVFAAAMVSGCATPVPVGGLFTDVTLPLQATAGSGGSKTGTAVCNSYLGMLSTGDCSIATAKANGGISTVTHMDWQANNILGLIGTYTLTVYGN